MPEVQFTIVSTAQAAWLVDDRSLQARSRGFDPTLGVRFLSVTLINRWLFRRHIPFLTRGSTRIYMYMI